jgi:hypothetical protein
MPAFGSKQTSAGHYEMSAYDPKRTSTAPFTALPSHVDVVTTWPDVPVWGLEKLMEQFQTVILQHRRNACSPVLQFLDCYWLLGLASVLYFNKPSIPTFGLKLGLLGGLVS